MSVVSLFLLRLYDGIRTEASRVNAEASTFRQDGGEMKHDLSLQYGKCFGLIPFLGWIETISLLFFFLHDELLGMLKAFFAGFLLR